MEENWREMSESHPKKDLWIYVKVTWWQHTVNQVATNGGTEKGSFDLGNKVVKKTQGNVVDKHNGSETKTLGNTQDWWW